MKNHFNKMDDNRLGRFDEQTNLDHLTPEEKQPEFDVIGTALNEI